MKNRYHLLERRKKLTGLLLAAPVLLGTFVFFLLPFAICVKYSFTFGVGGAYFVGFDNYKEVFSSYAFQLAKIDIIFWKGEKSSQDFCWQRRFYWELLFSFCCRLLYV